MAKRKQPEAAEPPNEPAAAEAAADEPAAKRRRLPSSAGRPAAKAGTTTAPKPARQSGGGSAAAAAAAAAAGRAESDVEDAREEEQAAADAQAAGRGAASPDGSQGAEEQQQQAAGQAAAAEERAGEDAQRRWVGVTGPVTNRSSDVVRWGASILFFPHQGSRERVELKMGYHATQEAAARIHDRAVIALHGRKGAAASGLLNFGVEQYPGEQQRYGPDLNAFLLQLCALGEPRPRGGKKKARPPRKSNGGSKEHMRRMREASLAKAAAKPPKPPSDQALHEGMAAIRRRDPLHTDHITNCGVCPACRQPWRADLGGCQRKVTAKAAGHSERAVIEMLVCDRSLRSAAVKKWQAQRTVNLCRAEERKAQRQAAAGSESEDEEQAQQAAGDAGQGAAGGQAGAAGAQRADRAQQEAGRAAGAAAAAFRAAAVEEEEGELEWLGEPPKPQHQLESQLRAMRRAAAAPLEQQEAWQAAQLAAALEREEQQHGAGSGAGAAAPAAAAGAAAGAAGAAAGVASAQPAERALIDPATGLTRAAAPRNIFPRQRAGELLQLVELCMDGGVEAPLVAGAAGQALQAAERQHAQLERLAAALLRRTQRGRSGSRAGSPDLAGQPADGTEAAAAAAAAAAAVSEGGASDADAAAGTEAAGGSAAAGMCPLCGGRWHRLVGLKACPVVKMALAVPKAPPACPGCAHLEQPGCKLCLGAQSKEAHHDKWGPVLEQPFARRVPWLEDVLPATRDLMQALQATASAAVADFDLPGAAWRCTPQALLAAGLLAEEAAKRELTARFPPRQAQQRAAHRQQQQVQQQGQQHQQVQQPAQQQQQQPAQQEGLPHG